MRKNYEAPAVSLEQFAANEYVAACYSLYCAIPGHNPYTPFDGTSVRNFSQNYVPTVPLWNTVEPDGKDHGAPCATGSSLDDATGNYYENGKLSAVGDITIGDPAPTILPNSYYAIWTSEDVNGTGTYNHYGVAVADSNPNHS